MSTHAAIGYKDNLGKYHIIYCHFDGYLSRVGAMLQSMYTNIKKIKKLVSYGDIDSIAATVQSCVRPGDGMSSTTAKHTDNLDDLMHGPYHYVYIYDMAFERWYVCHPSSPDSATLRPLVDCFKF